MLVNSTEFHLQNSTRRSWSGEDTIMVNETAYSTSLFGRLTGLIITGSWLSVSHLSPDGGSWSFYCQKNTLELHCWEHTDRVNYFFPFFNDVNLLKFCQNGDCPDLETWYSTTSDCCVSSERRKGPWDERSDGETHLLWLKPAQHKVKRQRQEMFEKWQKCSQWEESVNAQSIIKIINAQRWWIMLHNIQYSP